MLVFHAMHHHVVLLDGAERDVADVMHDEDLVRTDGQTVGRLEQLMSHALRGERLDPLRVAVVVAEHPGQRHAGVLERLQRERRAVIAGVQHHPDAALGHLLQQLAYRWEAIMRVRHQTDEHQASLQSGSSRSSRIRSSYVSRAVTTANRWPSTITSAARGRAL